MIPPFLLSPTFLIGLAAFAGGFGAAWTVQGWRLDAARAETEVCTVKLGALGNQIEAQNGAVEELQKKAAAARAKSAQAAKIAQGATLAHAALLRSLDARIAAPAGKTCVDALKELRESK